MTPENRNAFNVALDDLKRSIDCSVGQNHESVQMIAQIESTLRQIEQKSLISSGEPLVVAASSMATAITTII